jgi:hypothetical protein
MIPRVHHVGLFNEQFIHNNNTNVVDCIDNNLQTHLNPMRAEREEEKYDIETNYSENLVTVKNKIYCCTYKHLIHYIAVVIITAILLFALLYIIYIVK